MNTDPRFVKHSAGDSSNQVFAPSVICSEEKIFSEFSKRTGGRLAVCMIAEKYAVEVHGTCMEYIFQVAIVSLPWKFKTV